MHISAKTLLKKLAQSFFLLSFSFQAYAEYSFTIEGTTYQYSLWQGTLNQLIETLPTGQTTTSAFTSDQTEDVSLILDYFFDYDGANTDMVQFMPPKTYPGGILGGGEYNNTLVFGYTTATTPFIYAKTENPEEAGEYVDAIGYIDIYNLGAVAPLPNVYNFIDGFDENIYWWFVTSIIPNSPTPEDTLASMQPNAFAMKNAFNSQYATLAYGLNHDCTVFDSKGICMSLFGRNTSVNDSAFDNNAAGVVLAYKPHSQFRVGTYVDQSLNSNTMAGVNVERSNPDFGIFGVWNKNANGQGLAIRAAANYGSRDLNVSRTAIDTAEAGVGKTDLDAYGALLEASYAYPINDAWTAKPYAALRYLSIQRDGYTETNAIDNPLSYSGLEQQTTSALVGLRFTGYLTPKVTTAVNVGVEHDLHHGIDNYRATGVDSLGFVNMDNQTDRTRPTAGARLSYAVAEQQFISAAVQYRKEIFMSESSVTGQVNYTIGF